ncbi:MAG: hypothetical protein QY317_16295 [Candidatus Jettenia caeni]|nr:MAG: hypothetical protein QY317_16295 [Candidatus Jettenia caeni]
MPQIHTKFKHLLYSKLIESGNYSLSDIARRMNIPTSTLYHYVEEGGPTFPVDLLASLYNATRDMDFLSFILNDTDMMPTPRQASKDGKSVLEETLEAVAASGIVVSCVQEAIRDKKIDNKEQEKIVQAINKVEKELEDLKNCVNNGRLV